MKLIRLTTDTNDGRFDNSFNDEIIIPPKSKIALQSLAVRSDIASITIDDDNHNVQFEIKTGNTRTIELDNTTYDENNNHLLLNDLQLKLNQGLVYSDSQSTDKFKNELGVQFKVDVAKKGQLQVQIANTRYAYSRPDDIREVFTVNGGATEELQFNGTNPVKIASVTSGVNQGRADEKHSMYSTKPFTTGSGVFRVKISSWTTSSTKATSGFEIGLCDSSPSTWTLPSIPDSKKTYAVRAFHPTTNFSIKTRATTGFNGVVPQVLPSSDGSGTATPVGANGDIIELSRQGKNIVATVFKSSEANGNVLFTEEYEVDSAGIPVPLFGYLAFHDSRGNIELVDLKFTPDAYLEPRPPALEAPDETDTLGSGARPLPAAFNSTIKKIDFGSSSLASFFGFNNITQIARSGLRATFNADNLFLAHIENDCYIILLENIQLESYDGLKQGRKSILASVPNPINGDRVIYEPNTNNYIELNNANPISLRNIRARIFYQDYTPVNTLGLSVLSLLVANQTE